MAIIFAADPVAEQKVKAVGIQVPQCDCGEANTVLRPITDQTVKVWGYNFSESAFLQANRRLLSSRYARFDGRLSKSVLLIRSAQMCWIYSSMTV
jgi:hypothetical protein